MRYNFVGKFYLVLTFSTTEVGRFLHTAPSALGGTSVSAFTPSRLMGYLQGLCHQPVSGFRRRFPPEQALYSTLEPPPISAWSLIRAFGHPIHIQGDDGKKRLVHLGINSMEG